MADEPKLRIHGVEYEIPIDFTLGELADIEKITGQGYDLGEGGPLAIMALTYIALRRADAKVTIDDIRALKPEDISEVGTSVPLDEPEEKPNEIDETNSTSGHGSNGVSELPPDAIPARIGMPG